MLEAKEVNLAQKRAVALDTQESGRVAKELKDVKAARQARLAAEQRKWKKMERQKDSLEQKMQDKHQVTPLFYLKALMHAINFLVLICYLFFPILPFSTRAALHKMKELKKTNNILEKQIHGVQRDLEEARRERGIAL